MNIRPSSRFYLAILVVWAILSSVVGCDEDTKGVVVTQGDSESQIPLDGEHTELDGEGADMDAAAPNGDAQAPEKDGAARPAACVAGENCLGDPCDDGDDCFSKICMDTEGESLCSRSCEVDDDCPIGWSCQNILVNGGTEEALCAPVEVVTECDPEATEEVCDDANPCTSDACTEDGICAYTNLDSGVCDDSNPCTLADACSEGVCVGVPRDCADTNDCTTDVCVAGECTNTPHEGACESPISCLHNAACSDSQCVGGVPKPGWCYIDETCVSSGTPGPDGCTVCSPTQDTATWSPVGTIDGCVACTGSEGFCTPAGTCSNSVPCEDGLSCTLGSTCSSDGCSGATVKSDWCLIDGACYSEGALSPNGCRKCLSSVSQSSWSAYTLPGPCTPCGNGDGYCAADGSCSETASCDDGLSCTDNTQCGVAGCGSGQILSGWCLIDGLCLTNGAEHGSGCSQCDASTNATDWSPNTAAGACKPCSSGSGYCTENGGCAEQVPCDDGHSCTSESICDGLSCGTGSVLAGHCFIDGACYASGAVDSSGCQHCDPSTSTDSWTVKPDNGPCTLCASGIGHCAPDGSCSLSVQCDDGLSCTASSYCVSGACAAGPVTDGCLINGACITEGAENMWGCATCDSDSSPIAWTPNNSGGTCEQCYLNWEESFGGIGEWGHCDTDGTCNVSTNVACDDGLSCTLSSSCYSGQCADGAPKYNTCLINGDCYNSGEPEWYSCMECAPSKNQTDWTPRNSGDECISCTVYDDWQWEDGGYPGYCQADGTCAGTVSSDCDDGLECTTGTVSTCGGTGCGGGQLLSDYCLINGVCVASGAVSNTGCSQCKPYESTSEWSPMTTKSSCTACSWGGNGVCTDNGMCSVPSSGCCQEHGCSDHSCGLCMYPECQSDGTCICVWDVYDSWCDE